MPYAFSSTISDALCTFKRFHNLFFSPEFVLECEKCSVGNITAGQYVKATAGQYVKITASQYVNITVGQSVKTTAGHSVKTTVGQSVKITAGQSVKSTVGQSAKDQLLSLLNNSW